MDKITRTEAIMKALGWQGGTIHQVAEETGCAVHDLLYSAPKSEYIGTDFSHGWFAARTCTLEHNQTVNFPKHNGNIEFWLGVARGMQLKMQGI